MKIQSRNITEGRFDKSMGHLGGEIYKGRMPTRSFQLSWHELPANTKSLALIFIDHDAIPVCGFSWIHWTVANIDPAQQALAENASAAGGLLEGVNSWASGILPEAWKLTPEEATRYGGCAPPDQPHLYTIELYALDKKLALQKGFFMNELIHAMSGHVLEKATLSATYNNL